MSKQMRIAHAIACALQIVSGGAALADLIGSRWAGLVVLLVGGFQGGLVAYQAGQASGTPQPAEGDGAASAGQEAAA